MNKCPNCGVPIKHSVGTGIDHIERFLCNTYINNYTTTISAECNAFAHRIAELEAANEELRRYKAAWDWVYSSDGTEPVRNADGWFTAYTNGSYETPLEAVEAAMRAKQESTDAAKS